MKIKSEESNDRRESLFGKRKEKRNVIVFAFLFSLFSFLLFSFAQPNTNTRPPDFSAEVFEIARDLRCPVCQGESAGESNATVAVEMRRIIAEQLAQGKSREEIDAFFVQRYGDWILSRPPTSGINILPWLSPFLGFGLLAFGLWRYQRVAKARAVRTNSDVSEEEIRSMENKLEANRKP